MHSIVSLCCQIICVTMKLRLTVHYMFKMMKCWFTACLRGHYKQIPQQTWSETLGNRFNAIHLCSPQTHEIVVSLDNNHRNGFWKMTMYHFQMISFISQHFDLNIDANNLFRFISRYTHTNKRHISHSLEINFDLWP